MEYWACFGILLYLIGTVRSDGQVLLRFVRYSNAAGKRFDNDFCDEKFGIQTSTCDHYFIVCLGTTAEAGARCEYGQQTTRSIQNRNNIDFSHSVEGYSSPLVFTFSGRLQADMSLRVTVYDDDRKNDDLVDGLFTTVQINTNASRTVILQARTRLEVELRVECRSPWYGLRCGVRCDPGPHYTCDPTTGAKQCYPGYYGDACQYRITTTTVHPTIPQRRENEDCDTLAKAGYRYQDGVYTLQAREGRPFRAYCDMSAEGWTVIQRRTDGGVDFRRGWSDYRRGFGTPGARTEYWLGLDHIHHLTKYKRYKLRVTMQIGNHEFRFATYDRFSVGDVTSDYRLTVSGYSGTSGDALCYDGWEGRRLHSGQRFSTADHDRDSWATGNCAQEYGGGWWFNDCYWANLNGPYVRATNGWPTCRDGECVAWRTIRGYEDYSLLQTEMEIMPYDG